MNDDTILYESYDVVLRRNSDGLERTYHVNGAWYEHSDYWWTEGNGGCGLNLQMCSRMVFVGLSDSYETYYQCIRRCWRFGQTSPVDVHIVVSEAERGIVENVRQKEAKADAMAQGLLSHMRDFEREELAS